MKSLKKTDFPRSLMLQRHPELLHGKVGLLGGGRAVHPPYWNTKYIEILRVDIFNMIHKMKILPEIDFFSHH